MKERAEVIFSEIAGEKQGQQKFTSQYIAQDCLTEYVLLHIQFLLFYFCFMLYAHIQHIFTYPKMSSYIALLIKKISGNCNYSSVKPFDIIKLSFNYFFFFFKCHIHSLKGGMENEDTDYSCFIMLIFIAEENLTFLPLFFKKASDNFYCLKDLYRRYYLEHRKYRSTYNSNSQQSHLPNDLMCNNIACLYYQF